MADRLHSAAIHLLRHLRRVDGETALSAPRLSALSVIVFAGPITITELAAAEQVSAPTISRMVKELEGAGLVERKAAEKDRRQRQVRATVRGKELLREGRKRRLEALTARLEALSADEQQALLNALEPLERVALDKVAGTPRGNRGNQ